MKVSILFLCFASAVVSAQNKCPVGWTEWRGNCYRFFNQPRRPFANAEIHCHNFLLDEETCPCKHAHLVKVDSPEENDFLFNWWKTLRAPSNGEQRVWIGFSDDNHEGQWEWFDGSSGSFSKWDSGQPDNAGGNQDCALMWKVSGSDIGAWDDEGCEAKHLAFFCEFSL